MTRTQRARAADLGLVPAAVVLSLVAARASESGLQLYPEFVGVVPSPVAITIRPLSTLLHAGPMLLACALLWWRRRLPVAVAAAETALSVAAPTAVPLVIALFTVAATRGVHTTARTAGWALLPVPLSFAVNTYTGSEGAATAVISVILVGAAVGWGLYVRGVGERAERAGAEALLRAEQAQQRAREEVAREMHDVLAHRLSLLSVHAGALEFHPDAPPAEVQQAAGVIRESAHHALEDLQQVLRVLRTPPSAEAEEAAEAGRAAAGRAAGSAERPQPTLADVDRLLAEAGAAGAGITLERRLETGAVGEVSGRTAYRIVQEALTNARKHAPGAPVRVTLRGGPGAGLTVEVRNPLPHPGRTAAVPGAGQGLVGMAERAALAGGRLTHTRTDHGFRVRAWLPWSS